MECLNGTGFISTGKTTALPNDTTKMNIPNGRNNAGTTSADEGAADDTKPQRFNYGIVLKSDISDENKKREIVDLCQIACEKYAAAEKAPFERDNQAAAHMIKTALDKKMGGPFNVVVGEAFSVDIDYIQTTFMYMVFGGYLGIFVWKCI